MNRASKVFKDKLPLGKTNNLPHLWLAPMQDVTTLPFMNIIGAYGAPDIYVTEFLRVHEHAKLSDEITASVMQHTHGKPVMVQLIGENLPAFTRMVGELLQLPRFNPAKPTENGGRGLAGIDLNLGCPAPKVYKKNVGGGLLRDPARIDTLLAHLRDIIGDSVPFTVKIRTGFDSTDNYAAILSAVARRGADALTVHGRTVASRYTPGTVVYPHIRQAVESVPCPVIANGEVSSAAKAEAVLKETGAAGLMLGRSAIRNPWVFTQTRQHLAGEAIFQPTLQDAYGYIEKLSVATHKPGIPPRAHVGALKKFLNFIAVSVEPSGQFLHEVRRASSPEDMFEICARWMLENGNAEKSLVQEAYAGLVSRPNCESEQGCTT